LTSGATATAARFHRAPIETSQHTIPVRLVPPALSLAVDARVPSRASRTEPAPL